MKKSSGLGFLGEGAKGAAGKRELAKGVGVGQAKRETASSYLAHAHAHSHGLYMTIVNNFQT